MCEFLKLSFSVCTQVRKSKNWFHLAMEIRILSACCTELADSKSNDLAFPHSDVELSRSIQSHYSTVFPEPYFLKKTPKRCLLTENFHWTIPTKGLLKLFTAITIEHHIDKVKLDNDSVVIH